MSSSDRTHKARRRLKTVGKITDLFVILFILGLWIFTAVATRRIEAIYPPEG
jgi:hypothetical protein